MNSSEPKKKGTNRAKPFVVKLSKKKIDRTKPRSDRYTMWDSEITGLGLRVAPAGRKVFVLKYRTNDGTQRKPVIGSYSAVTLAQARKLAQDMLADVRAGKDPSAARKEARKAVTVGEACDQFIKEHVDRKVRGEFKLADNTRDLYRRAINKEIRPGLGEKKKLAAVTRKNVVTLLRSISRERPIMANRVQAVLSKLFSLAETEWEAIPKGSNPASGVGRNEERKRHRDLTELELARLGKALKEAEAEGADKRFIDVIRLLLFTGCRKTEILSLKWSEVDLERGFLRIKTKTGPQLVHLNSAAREILERQNRLLANPHVFPARRKPGAHCTATDLYKTWDNVRARAALGAREDIQSFRVHDFRHNVASTGAAEGLSLHTIGSLLGHKKPDTTHRYADLTDSAARQASEAIGKRLTEAMEKEADDTG